MCLPPHATVLQAGAARRWNPPRPYSRPVQSDLSRRRDDPAPIVCWLTHPLTAGAHHALAALRLGNRLSSRRHTLSRHVKALRTSPSIPPRLHGRRNPRRPHRMVYLYTDLAYHRSMAPPVLGFSRRHERCRRFFSWSWIDASSSRRRVVQDDVKSFVPPRRISSPRPPEWGGGGGRDIRPSKRIMETATSAC